MLTDAHFAELCRLYKRCRPWSKKRPPWFLFQMWLRRRPMNHEFLVSPLADYLLSVGVRNETVMQIAWPAWCDEFVWRYIDLQGQDAGFQVRDCLAALDSMRGWTPKLNINQTKHVGAA